MSVAPATATVPGPFVFPTHCLSSYYQVFRAACVHRSDMNTGDLIYQPDSITIQLPKREL